MLPVSDDASVVFQQPFDLAKRRSPHGPAVHRAQWRMTLAAFWKHRRGNLDPGKVEPVAWEEHVRIPAKPIPPLHGLMRNTQGMEIFADRFCGVTE